MSSKFLNLTLLLLSISCSQFEMRGSFLVAQNEDSAFFSPEDDFPVVSGDTGRSWDNEEEQNDRTPASQEDLLEDQTSRLLKQELRNLEESQSEESSSLYKKHHHQLVTTSEKIYYLKLLPRERREYLMVRGFIAAPKLDSFFQDERLLPLNKKDIQLGMSKNNVAASWGKPKRIDIAGNPQNENERWLYKMNGAPKYIYFEAGQVQGWE